MQSIHLVRKLLPAVALVLAAACGGTSTGGTGSGVIGKPGGQCSQEGAHAPAADGCNTCTCSNGSYACTEMACIQDGGGLLACSTPGAKKDAGDGCNTCTCSTTGEWICTRSACNVCQPGETKQQACAGACTCVNGAWSCETCTGCACDGGPAPVCVNGQTTNDGCNTCTCMNGGWACTTRACPPPQCTPGSSMFDGCNTCTCTGGAWACTDRACPPPPVDAGHTVEAGPGPTFCGGFAGNTCSQNQYCAYTQGAMCGAADAEATCQPRPSICDTNLSPVCGCDGKDYTNSCQAAMAGTGVNHAGSCAAVSG